MYKVSLLGSKHCADSFDCGVDSLSQYIGRFALKDIKRKISVTYVVATEDSPCEIIAYYCLSQFFIGVKNIDMCRRKKLPKYPNMPATLLGRFAVDERFQRKRIGDFMLFDAMERSLLISKQIASHALVVDAINDKATNFYQKYGFLKAEQSASKLYLPMDEIQKRLAE